MSLLPIVGRELRTAARRRSTYWLRLAAAVLVLLVGIWVYLLMQASAAPRDISLALFGVLAFGAVLHCWLSGLSATADCISQEKREGTLGLLFLTDLKGYDVVLGKFAASSMNSFYGMLACLPMLAIPLLMGGVAPTEFGRMALVAVDTLFFSLTLGLFASAMSRSARSSLGLAVLVLLLCTAGSPLVAAILTEVKGVAEGRVFYFPSAGFAFATAFDWLYVKRPTEFWLSLATIHGLAWLWLLLASLVAPRSWQDRPAGARRLRWRERWRLWSYGNFAERNLFRQRLLDRNAFFWLAARARLKPAVVWATLGVLGCGWVWAAAKWRRDWFNGTVYFMTALLLNGLIKFWFACEAGRQLAEDRRLGALELLLSTPISVREILRGQRLALQRHFLGPVLLVLGLFIIFMLATLQAASDESDRRATLWLYCGGSLLLFADLAGLHWSGMWQALVARNPHRAVTGNILRILVLPWVVYAVILLVLALSWLNRDSGPDERFFIGLWVGLSLLADCWFGAWARYKLLGSFRSAAERRYSTQAGFWKWLFGASGTSRPSAPPSA